MLNTFLFCIVLLHISASNTMNIIQNDCINRLTDDLIVYHIGPHLDRLDRNNFRLTNVKHFQLILPQALLNANYAQACEDNNTPKIIEWRKQGALKLYEEVCALAFHNQLNKRLLAEKLCSHYPKTSIIIDGLAYAITQNNLSFVQWILNTSRPPYRSRELRSLINFSVRINRCAITTYLNHYIDREKYEEERNESYNGRHFFYDIP